jgi:hypothetical protein
MEWNEHFIVFGIGLLAFLLGLLPLLRILDLSSLPIVGVYTTNPLFQIACIIVGLVIMYNSTRG